MDSLANVSPRIPRIRQTVPIPRELLGRVPDDVEQIRIQPCLPESSAPCESLGVALDDDGVPAATAGAELARDDNRAGTASPRWPVVFGPLTDLQLEPELGLHTGSRRHAVLKVA
jgi:hypothetical protein